MQDEMERFEAEISKSAGPSGNPTKPSSYGPTSFQPSQLRMLPKPPAPPANLAAMVTPPSTTLFLPPQLQRAGVRPQAAQASVHTSSSITAAAAVISNKPVLYMPEKEGKMPNQPNLVKAATPVVKKPKVEPKPAAPAPPPVVSSGPSVLKAPSSTVGSATVKAGDEPKVPKYKKPKKFVRAAGGQIWQDDSLLDWDPNDYRIFCGDLGNDVTDEVLARVFGKYSSFQRAKVIRDKRSNKTKGFGFVSFKDPADFTRAMKELNGKYVGSRPIKLRRSNWKNRNIEDVRKRQKEKDALLGKRK